MSPVRYVSSDSSHSEPSAHDRADMRPLTKPHSKSSQPRSPRPVIAPTAFTRGGVGRSVVMGLGRLRRQRSPPSLADAGSPGTVLIS